MRYFLTCILVAAVASSCAESVEEPDCDEFSGNAIVTGVVLDFDGIPLGNAQVEFALFGAGDNPNDFGLIVGQGTSDEAGAFEVELRAANTEGKQSVIGRVVRSDTSSAGLVEFTSDCEPDTPYHELELDLIATPSAVIPPDLKIGLYRRHSHNVGPHYGVSVDAAGVVDFEGYDNVIKPGIANGLVSLFTVARLYRELEYIQIWNIEQHYDINECSLYFYDVHYASIGLIANGRGHSVWHDHGCCGVPELEPLADIECRIDDLLETIQWTGSAAEPCGWPPGQVCPPSN
jgi:hypothetical protein